MKKLSSILVQYRILLYVLSPLILFYTLMMAYRHKDRRYLMERFGFYRTTGAKQPIWIHAASVGEVNAVIPLIHELKAREPDIDIMLTTGTPTGGRVALNKLPEGVEHRYLPIDWSGAVSRFLKATKPLRAVIMETELWANLYHACADHNIDILIINGRLSAKTLHSSAWMYRLYADTLSNVRMIYTRSDDDANAFITIGATASKIKTIGNIKFAISDIKAEGINLGRPFVLAASTHDDEEKQLVQMWQDIEHANYLLVIAPRHPDRLDNILKQLEPFQLNLALRSKGDEITDETDVLIVDTLGELETFISSSELVFVGGSLVPHGGHNIIEVAKYAKPIIFGPHMANFADESKTFLSSQAAIQVNNLTELQNEIQRLLGCSETSKALGEKAEKILHKNSDIAERYVNVIIQPCTPNGPLLV